jgi:putative transcriptional regulator
MLSRRYCSPWRTTARKALDMKENRDYPALVKDVRRQLALSQEDLARALGVSYATVNRWENGQVRPSKLGQAQFKNFCAGMIEKGKLILPHGALG